LRESAATQSRVFRGKAAHSSTPQLGESAIKKMLEYLSLMPEDLTIMEIEGGVNFNSVPANAYLEIDPVAGYQRPMSKKLITVYRAICDLENKFLQYEEEGFSPSCSTLNIGVIKTLENQVFIAGNCRTNPSVSFEVYQLWMDELRRVCIEIGADFRVTDYKLPFAANIHSGFVQESQNILRAMGLPEALSNLPSTNEASLLNRIGIECLCFGAGLREGNIHTPSEHVEVAHLHQAIDFYKNAIERFCL
jgi:succinyl-diaminopimelate desuccinylase